MFRFKQIQRSTYDFAENKTKSLPNDCKTCWNSTFKLLDRCCELKYAINNFFKYLDTTQGKEEFPDGVSCDPIGDTLWVLAKLLVIIS